jgi:hypothetical protein
MRRLSWSLFAVFILLGVLLVPNLIHGPSGTGDSTARVLAQQPPTETPITRPTRGPRPTPGPTRTPGPTWTPGPTPLPASNVEATVYGNTIRWRTVPASIVRVEIRNAAGQMRGAGAGVADDTGNVTITLGGGGGMGPAAGGGSVNPGDEIRLIPTGAGAVGVRMPDLAVGAAVASNHVVGKGPASAALALEVTYGPDAADVFRQTVTTAATGAVDVALAPPAVLAPGVSGSLTLTTPENNVFHATFNVLEAEVSLGGRQVNGNATLGTTVRARVTSSGGQAKGNGNANVLGQPAWAIAGGGGGGGGGRFGQIAAGDVVSVTQVGTLPGTTFTVQGTVPNVTVRVDLPRSTVEGSGPPSSPIEVVLTSPYGETFVRTGTTDASGNFSVAISDVAGFGRGWRAAVRFTIVPGLRVTAYHVIAQVRVGVHSSVVNGVAQPGMPITVTIRAADGTAKGSDSTNSNNQGQYQTAFNGPARIVVGDRVEVEFVGGDPVVVQVVPVSARTDPATNVVSGVAPSGTSVRVSRTVGATQSVINTTADAGGNYRADFTGTLDIEPPMNGDLVVRLASGHELFTTWAAVRMTMEIREPLLTGNGPSGRAVNAELVDPSGGVVAAGETTVGGGGGGPMGGGAQWNLQFEDSLGAPVDIRVGDTVRATVGDDVFNVKVPELSGVAFVADDLVNGKTTPSRAVTMRVQRAFTGENAMADVTADAQGNFTHDFAGAFDIQHNDAILFTTLEGGHVINSRLAVPGLRLDLDLGVLVGSWRPDTEILYQLRGAGGVRSSGRATTNADAVFNVQFADASGNRVLPQQGDIISVEPMSGDLDDPLEMTVPELTITWDVDTDAMGGRATPGGALVFLVSDVIERGLPGPPTRRNDPAIGTDGAYAVTFMPPFNLVPGIQMQAIYRIPSGHLVLRTRYAPLLNAQLGGANACGFTNPREQVDARLSAADGTRIAEGSALSSYDSRYLVQLADAETKAAISAEGQTVRATLAGKEASVTFPPLSVQVDWDRGRIQGQGPAGTFFQVLRPARGCLDTGNRQQVRGMVNPQGAFNAGIQGGLDPGQGFEIALFTEAGHRYYRHVFRSLGQIWVFTDLVTGRATPSTPVAVVLTDAAGTEKGRATTIATANGTFLVHLVNASGKAVMSQPGDKIRLEASGENPEIVVEDLRFDWSLGEPIVGNAPAGRTVAVTVNLEDGGSATFTLQADAQGTFRFGATDVPPRSAWGLADIRGVRTVIETPNGHQIIAGTNPPTEPETPSKVLRIFLPRALKKY